MPSPDVGDQRSWKGSLFRASPRYFVDALTSSVLRRDSAKFTRRGTAEGGSSGSVPNVCQKRPAGCADEEGVGERAFGNAC